MSTEPAWGVQAAERRILTALALLVLAVVAAVTGVRTYLDTHRMLTGSVVATRPGVVASIYHSKGDLLSVRFADTRNRIHAAVLDEWAGAEPRVGESVPIRYLVADPNVAMDARMKPGYVPTWGAATVMLAALIGGAAVVVRGRTYSKIEGNPLSAS